MPVVRCSTTVDGETRPGFRWGRGGTCYPYTAGDASSRERARARARRQGQAIELERQRQGKPSEFEDEECEDCKIEESAHHRGKCKEGYHEDANGNCVKNK